MVVKSPVTEYHETEDIFLTHCYISIKIKTEPNYCFQWHIHPVLHGASVGHLEAPGKGSSAHAEQLCMPREVLIHPDCKGLPIQTYNSV